MVFSKELFQAFVSKAKDLVSVSPELGVTLEANPSDLSEERLEGFLSAGINRLSVGFQVRFVARFTK